MVTGLWFKSYQVIEKYVLGQELSPFWDPVRKESTIIAHSDLTEFQEGTRNDTSNKSKPHVPNREGTGVEHRHLIIWTSECVNSFLACNVRADLAAGDELLEAAVVEAQLSHKADLLVHDGATYWHPVLGRDGRTEAWELIVSHPPDAHRAHVRGYLPTVILARVGHVDFQVIRKTAQVAQYTAAYVKYSTKSSFALDPTALEKGTSGSQAAYAMLQYLQPSAAQMLVALQFGSLCRLSCATKEAFLRTPDDVEFDLVFAKYLRCTRRVADCCFISWLRSFRTDIPEPTPYERVRGKTAAVGVVYGSRFTDSYFGQWLVAWVPWSAAGIHLPPSAKMVPLHLRWFEACRKLRPEYWTSMSYIKADLEIEGHKDDYIRTFLAHVRANHDVCDMVLAGELVMPNFPASSAAKRLELCGAQLRAVQSVISAAKAVQEGTAETSGAYALLGPAGCGKSAALNEIINRCVTARWPVYVCSPTGALSDVYRREFFGHSLVTVDTFDGLFHFLTAEGPQPFCILDAAVVIIDEIGMLGINRFEFAMRCWYLAGRRAVLVMAGDFGQQGPPSGDALACTSAYWTGPRHRVTVHTLSKQHRMTTAYESLINPLRFHWASPRTLQKLVGHRVFGEDQSWISSCKEFFRLHPGGVVMAARLATVARLNEQILDGYFGASVRYMQCLDLNANEIVDLPVAEGCRIMVTYNCDKDRGVVNGAFGTVLRIRAACLVLRLDSAATVHVARRPLNAPRKELGFPVVLGYASTVAKMQGRTLTAVALDLDLRVPGLAYTAITRVREVSRIYWCRRPSAADFVPKALCSQ